MAVFDDPKKELARIQAQIEEQEDWFEKELDSAKRLIGDAPRAAKPTSAAAGVPARNNPKSTATRKAAPKEVPVEEPKKKGVKGLVILALVEILGIAGIAAYWLLHLL